MWLSPLAFQLSRSHRFSRTCQPHQAYVQFRSSSTLVCSLMGVSSTVDSGVPSCSVSSSSFALQPLCTSGQPNFLRARWSITIYYVSGSGELAKSNWLAMCCRHQVSFFPASLRENFTCQCTLADRRMRNWIAVCPVSLSHLAYSLIHPHAEHAALSALVAALARPL